VALGSCLRAACRGRGQDSRRSSNIRAVLMALRASASRAGDGSSDEVPCNVAPMGLPELTLVPLDSA